MLSEAMNIIQARNQLRMLDACSYPHADDNSRKKIHRKYSEIAYPTRFKEKVSLDDAFKIFEEFQR